MDSSIEWSPVRSIAAAAADNQQQLASQAANELRMRSLQVHHHSYLTGVLHTAMVKSSHLCVNLCTCIQTCSEVQSAQDMIQGRGAGWTCRMITCTLSLRRTPYRMSLALSQKGS